VVMSGESGSLPAIAGASLGSWAALGSAVAAAVAALASWASVVHATRMHKRQLAPWLSIDVAQVLDAPGERAILVSVENSGGGIAKEVWLWARENRKACVTGLPPRGALGPGRGVTLRTGLSAGQLATAEAVVICRHGSRLHAWDAAGRHKSWRLDRTFGGLRSLPSNEDMVRAFYPRAPTVTSLQLVGYEVERAD
jgi:hypothetical protein